MSTSYLPPAQSLCVRGQRGTGSGSRFLSPFRASAGVSVWASNNASDLINTGMSGVIQNRFDFGSMFLATSLLLTVYTVGHFPFRPTIFWLQTSLELEE